MTLPRSSLISLDDTPYYHCVSRCVRRAFLCGTDHYTGQCYEHRRNWLESKLHFLASTLAIKLCAYAIMSNHYHVVLHVRKDQMDAWSDREVIRRWHRLYKGSLISQKFAAGEVLLEAEAKLLKEQVNLWRSRLCSISWFMKNINESISRRANAEDKCTGAFWESRFKSQALLDEHALLSCMAYVDLNPIRAKMANTPETSDHTSIKQRIELTRQKKRTPKSLESFVGIKQDSIGIPFKLEDYIELIDWSGRIIHKNKRGHINNQTPPILERLGLNNENWQALTTGFEDHFQHWVGTEHIVARVCQNHGYQRVPKSHIPLTANSP